MNENTYTITREKHLDHLVKVVPLIVLGYAIQCYILMQLRGPLGPSTLILLACSLAFMIACFITYDIKHQVVLSNEHLEVSFFFFHTKISYQEIKEIKLSDEISSFSTVLLKTQKKNIRLYFVDDAVKIKEWIESRKSSSLPLAA